MKIYVTSYAAYNQGNPAGLWLNLEDYSDEDELREAATEALNARAPQINHEELFFTDYEDFPKAYYSESAPDFSGLYELLELDEDDREKVAAYDRAVGDSTTDTSDKLDAVVDQVEPGPFDKEWKDWATGLMARKVLARHGIDAKQSLLDDLASYLDSDFCAREAEHDYLYDRESGYIFDRNA